MLDEPRDRVRASAAQELELALHDPHHVRLGRIAVVWPAMARTRTFDEAGRGADVDLELLAHGRPGARRTAPVSEPDEVVGTDGDPRERAACRVP